MNRLPSNIIIGAISILSSVSSYAIEAPILKWKHGGCYNSWCETGWYASPAIVDLNQDGQIDVIASLSSVFSLNGETGALQWRVNSGHDLNEGSTNNVGRTWPAVVVRDIDRDGVPEVITAHNRGHVSVYDSLGQFKAGWPQRPSSRELRGLTVDDIDGDGTDEVIVSAAVASRINTWVFEHDGQMRPGWPQPSTDTGSAWGVFNNNATTGDLDGDGLKEIIVPSDVTRVQAYHPDGSLVMANAQFSGQTWGELSAWEDPEIEMRGWGTCKASDPRSERYRANFAYGAAEVADLDGDGSPEVIVSGNMYDCSIGNDSSGNRYNTVFVFNADRSRYHTLKGDWRSPPLDTGAALSEDYNLIENNQPNPAVVDLDNDGINEIIYPAFDGRVHALWLDKTEHHSWPFHVVNSGENIYRFASEVAIVDIEGDGFAEIVFTSWTQKGSTKNGHLHILDYQGRLLQKVELPSSKSTDNWDGGLAAPTLGNIDNDDELEIVITTAHAGVVVYDLPGSSNAKVLWSNGSAIEHVMQPPYLKSIISGTQVTLDWGKTPSASSYSLYYAPHPYQGAETIQRIDQGKNSRIEFEMWNDFAFYVAIKSTMTPANESDFSNVELIINP